MSKYWYGALLAFAAGTIAVIVLLFYGKLIPDTSQGAISLAKDIVSITVPIASFVVGTYYARKAYKFQQDIATKKPQLRFLINNITLIPDSSTGIKEVVFGFVVEKGARVLCAIPWLVINDEEISAHNVQVRVSLPRYIAAPFTKIDVDRTLGDVEGIGFRRRSYPYKDRWIVDYIIPELQPGTGGAVGGYEMVEVTYSSAIDFKVDAVLRDNVPVTTDARLEFISEVNISVSLTETKPLSNSFLLKSYDTVGIDEIVERVLEERDTSLRKRLKVHVSFRDFLKNPLTIWRRFSVPVDNLRKTIIIIPKLEKTAGAARAQHFSLYIERPEESEKYVLNPAASIADKMGISESYLKRVFSSNSPKKDSS